MAEFDRTKLRRLDVTLLLVFLGLVSHRKASVVAAELGLTNSSISHALRRLRDVFQDDLFTRLPHGLQPTAFALAIEPDIRRSLEALQASLSGPAPFDPETAEVHVHLSARDSEIAATMPEALARIRAQAPGLTFAIQSMAAKAALQGLRDASIDLALGFFSSVPADIDVHPVRRETYLVVGRRDHVALQGDLTLERYASAAHVLVTTDGSMRGIVDERLQEIGLTRRVVLSMPQFLPALAVVAQTQTIATLPATIVRMHAERFGLAVAEPPLTIRAFDVRLLCHARNRRNAALQWCIERFLRTAQT